MTNIADCDAHETTWGGFNGCAGRLPHILRRLTCIALMLVATGCRAPGDKADVPNMTANAKGMMNLLASTAQAAGTINSRLKDLKSRTLTPDEQREAVRLEGLMETLRTHVGPFMESCAKALETTIERHGQRTEGVNDALEAGNDSIGKALDFPPGSAENQRALQEASRNRKKAANLITGGRKDDDRSHKRFSQAINMIDIRVEMEPEQLEEMFKRATALLEPLTEK